MTKLKRATSSKPIPTPVEPSHNSIHLDHSLLVLHVKHQNYKEGALKPIYLFRALYHGVPPADSVNQTVMHHERLPLVQHIYEWLAAVSEKNGNTAETYSRLLYCFFRFCDFSERKAELTESCVSAYAQHIRIKVRDKPESTEQPRQMATTFAAFLVWAGHDELAILLPKVVRKNALVNKTAPYSDDEQIGVARDLFRVFNVLTSRLRTGEPTTCPFDQPALYWDVGPANNTSWYNKLTATALFLTANFVGDNRAPLLKMRRNDVTKRAFQFDKTINLYRLITTKNRQGGQKNPWDLGFTQRGREFFNAYLNCLDLFNLPEDTYLFPRFIHGQYLGPLCHSDLRKYLDWFTSHSPHGVRPLIGRFRQSKSDGLMADTNSIAIVAEGLNNLKTTAARHYMNGNPHENRNRLGSSAEALELTARGATLEDARKAVEEKYGKPLRVMEIAASGDSEPIQTKVGTRCKEPFGEKAQRLKRELVKSGLLTEGESVACFKFLDCFECEYRALVAEVDDIWCMLSFRESLLEALQRPTINHNLPVAKIHDVIAKTQIMLVEIEQSYPDVYAEAVNKFNHQAHPLWGDEDSVSDLYEIW